MLRNLFAACFYLGLVPPAVLGAPIQLINGLPSFYTPGQPVAFDVSLPNISNLGSYNIDVVLVSNTGTAGVDYFFGAAATLPATSHYVFPSAVNYFDAVTVDSATRDRITLTDFDFGGANVVAGANDRVATVVLRTSPTFSGPLSVFVDAPLLILDTPDVVPTPVAGFEAIQNGVAAAGPVDLTPVPEPSSVYLGVIVLITLFSARHGRSFVGTSANDLRIAGVRVCGSQ